MCSNLEYITGNDQVKAEQGGIELLTMINNIMCGVEESLPKKMVIVMAEETLHTFRQNTNLENDNYKSQFNTYVTVLEAYMWNITVPLALVYGNTREL